MICSSCSKVLDSDAKFCDGCGMPIASAFNAPETEPLRIEKTNSAAPPAPAPPVQPYPQQTAPPAPKKDGLADVKKTLNTAKGKLSELDIKGKAATFASGVSAAFTNKPVEFEGGLHCARCGVSLPAYSKFCDVCGAPVQAKPVSDAGGLVCKNCKATLKEGMKFCNKCGAPVEKAQALICKSCGAQIPEDSKFCDKCGVKIINSTSEEV